MLPVIGEYERTLTTVINAYIGPIVARYLTGSAASCDGRGRRAAVGDAVERRADAARGRPRRRRRSSNRGRPAGVVGVAELGAGIGYDKAISFDMGGTTAKAA